MRDMKAKMLNHDNKKLVWTGIMDGTKKTIEEATWKH